MGRDSLADETNVDSRVADFSLSERSMVKRIAIVSTIGVVLVATATFKPAYRVWRHQKYYGEAESTVDQIRELTFELDNLDKASVRQLLNTGKFRQLKERETDIALLPGELHWFQVNEMYSVGLRDDGGILWMTDGVRAANR